VSIAAISTADLNHADEVFFCKSVFGVVPEHNLYMDEKILTYEAGSFAAMSSRLFENALVEHE
jgi:branched-subunit amino acid aminotransferase/4-amino-4-deoxychorismate lyase